MDEEIDFVLRSSTSAPTADDEDGAEVEDLCRSRRFAAGVCGLDSSPPDFVEVGGKASASGGRAGPGSDCCLSDEIGPVTMVFASTRGWPLHR